MAYTNELSYLLEDDDNSTDNFVSPINAHLIFCITLLSIYSIIDCFRCRYVCINSKNNNDVVMCITLIMKYSIEKSYPDIGIKRYSNNGRIVDADDEYLSTSEWRNINRLFRIH